MNLIQKIRTNSETSRILELDQQFLFQTVIKLEEGLKNVSTSRSFIVPAEVPSTHSSSHVWWLRTPVNPGNTYTSSLSHIHIHKIKNKIHFLKVEEIKDLNIKIITLLIY